MTQKTSIEWVKNADGTQGHSANPIRFRMKDTGNVVHFCVKTSAGCAHCYSESMSRRWGSPEFIARNLDEVAPFLDEGVLRAIIKRRKPTVYFVCDMTDWMGSWVPDEFIDRTLAAIALSPQHTFQLLTKRADRLAAYFAGGRESPSALRICELMGEMCHRYQPERLGEMVAWLGTNYLLPMSNLWLGVSCENQATADERIPHLLNTPAAIRFVSAEPLIGPLHLDVALSSGDRFIDKHLGWLDVLDWVIVGGESGHHARPCEVAWIRSIIEQCREAEIACFVKQLGRLPVIAEQTVEQVRARASDEYNWPEGTRFGNPSQIGSLNGRVAMLNDSKGGDIETWPADLRIRQMPTAR